MEVRSELARRWLDATPDCYSSERGGSAGGTMPGWGVNYGASELISHLAHAPEAEPAVVGFDRT